MREKESAELIDRYRVAHRKRIRLADFDPGDTGPYEPSQKKETEELLREGVQALAEMQEKLYAQDQHALLIVLQGMDAAGKDSTIKHVMSGLNPQGCTVATFKQPSSQELDHDYLWHCYRELPGRGRIGIFNRSYYEEVLVVRVHRELLERERLPKELITPDIWTQRYEDFHAFESYLERNGIAVRKIFLNLSRAEQKRRFLKRLEEPEKNWKCALADVAERDHWEEYQRAYEEMLPATSTKAAPWFVIPADHKWFTRLVVAEIVIDALRRMDLRFPVLDAQRKEELRAIREKLERSDP